MQIGYWEPVVHLIIGRGTFALLVYAPRYDNPSKVMHLEQSDGKHWRRRRSLSGIGDIKG